MIIVLKQGTTQQEIDTVTNAVVARGVSVSPIVGTEMTILGLTGDTSRIDPDQLESFHCVERIMKVAEPFKKANRAFHPAPSEIKIGNTVVGGKKLAIMAGPCSVESCAAVRSSRARPRTPSKDWNTRGWTCSAMPASRPGCPS